MGNNFVTFREYWDTFFCWSDLDFDKNYRKIKNKYYTDYVAYCEYINQVPEVA